MNDPINEKRLPLTIGVVTATPYRRRSRMVTIGKMPRKSKRFFRPVAGHFAFGGFEHFWQLVLALTISHAATIERLAELLRGPHATHRTNHGEFLWRSDWDESWVLQQIALDTLRRLDRLASRGVADRRVYFIIDERKHSNAPKR